MDEATITANQWNQLAYLNVSKVPMIYLLGLSAPWPNNCEISCYGIGYSNDDINELKKAVVKVINYRSKNE